MATKRQRLIAELDGLVAYGKAKGLPAPYDVAGLDAKRNEAVAQFEDLCGQLDTYAGPVHRTGASMAEYVRGWIQWGNSALGAAAGFGPVASLPWSEADIARVAATLTAFCRILLEE
jgi:hypothetical protein